MAGADADGRDRSPERPRKLAGVSGRVVPADAALLGERPRAAHRPAPYSVSTARILFPIHSMTGTAMLLPSAL